MAYGLMRPAKRKIDATVPTRPCLISFRIQLMREASIEAVYGSHLGKWINITAGHE
jgi:hypothetical protein